MGADQCWHSQSEPYEFVRVGSSNTAHVDSTYGATVAAADTYRTFNGYTFYLSTGTGRFTFYNGTDTSGGSTKLLTVHCTAGPNSDTKIIDAGLKAHNGLYLKVEAGDFEHIGVLYR